MEREVRGPGVAGTKAPCMHAEAILDLIKRCVLEAHLDGDDVRLYPVEVIL